MKQHQPKFNPSSQQTGLCVEPTQESHGSLGNSAMADRLGSQFAPFPADSRGAFLVELLGRYRLIPLAAIDSMEAAVIEYAVGLEVMSAQSSVDAYRLSDPITRAEATAFCARKLGVAPLSRDIITRTFPDLPITHVLAPEIYACVQQGRIHGYSREEIRPEETVDAGAFRDFINKLTQTEAPRFDPVAPPVTQGSRDPTASDAERVAQSNRIIDELDVENNYLPDDFNGNGYGGEWVDLDGDGKVGQGEIERTFCNSYAFDWADRMGVFLPREIYAKDGQMDHDRQEAAAAARETEVPKVPGEFLYTRANHLHEWFELCAHHYGWGAIGAVSPEVLREGQAAADAGRAVVLIGRRAGGASGHISILAPQRPDEGITAIDQGGGFMPVVSQAGSVNYNHLPDNQWSIDPSLLDKMVWVHA